MMNEQTGLPSYEENSFGGDDERTPILTDDDIQRLLNELRQNSVTGVLDISGVPIFEKKPFEFRRPKLTKRKGNTFHQKPLPKRQF